MILTNPLLPHELLAEFLYLRGKTDRDTAWYQTVSHDELCELVATKIELMLDYYKRYYTNVTFTQGMRDHGVDVLFRISQNECSHRIGFQIKSDKEAAASKSKGEVTIVGKLKAQYSEATNIACVTDWYILPCFCLPTHRRIFHSINTELSAYRIGSKPVVVIPPENVLAFILMDDDVMLARCEKLLCKEDEVLRALFREFARLSTLEREIILSTVFNAIEDPSARIDSESINLISQGIPHKCDLASAVENLERLEFLIAEDDRWRICPRAFPALCAIYFENIVRHDQAPFAAAKAARALALL